MQFHSFHASARRGFRAALVLALPFLWVATASADVVGDDEDIVLEVEEEVVTIEEIEPMAPPPMAPMAAGPKWTGWIGLSGKAGNDRQLGRLETTIPFWQDPRSLAFLDIRGMGDSHNNVDTEVGLAYRHITDSAWILGTYGFFDIRSSERYDKHHKTFLAGTVGLEALTENLDFRVNGYIPDSDSKNVRNPGNRHNRGPMFASRATGRERALYGVNGEIGVRVPFSEDSPLWDTRVLGGVYYFDANGYRHRIGPTARVETRIHDLPLLGEYARLIIGGEMRYDNVDSWVAFGSAGIQIPFWGFLQSGDGVRPELTKLERRMLDPIVRDVD